MAHVRLTDPQHLRPRTEPFRDWPVPEGFETFDLVEIINGPVTDPRTPNGTADFNLGPAHVYDRDGLRIVVRPGTARAFEGNGWVMVIESIPNHGGVQGRTAEYLLDIAADEVRAHERSNR